MQFIKMSDITHYSLSCPPQSVRFLICVACIYKCEVSRCFSVLRRCRMHTPADDSKAQWRMKGIVGSDLFKYPCGTGAHPRALPAWLPLPQVRGHSPLFSSSEGMSHLGSLAGLEVDCESMGSCDIPIKMPDRR